jgi:hypothetical protein
MAVLMAVRHHSGAADFRPARFGLATRMAAILQQCRPNHLEGTWPEGGRTMSDDPFKQFDKLDFKNAIGRFEWWPDWDVLRERLFKPVVESAEDRDDEAIENVLMYLRRFFVSGIQDAALQAVEELIAVAKASATRDRHRREEIAKQVAEKAREASRERLRALSYFKKSPKRGDKKRPSTSQWVQDFVNELHTFRARLEKAIASLLKQGTRPTISNVARLMNMSEKTLGRTLSDNC